MAQALVAANGLPESPLDAALHFYQRHVPQILAAGDDCAVLFDPADHSHHAWRLAAVQQLARDVAPARARSHSLWLLAECCPCGLSITQSSIVL